MNLTEVGYTYIESTTACNGVRELMEQDLIEKIHSIDRLKRTELRRRQRDLE